MDISGAPILADINVNGKAIKAVALPTKQGFLYVFDRVTGEPVWPIEERPVEKGNVPGEWYAPTQPFPTKPPAYSRNGVTPDVLIDFTPELHDQALTNVAKFKTRPRLHAARREQHQRTLRDTHARHRGRRNQLARRLLRSRDPHGLRLCLQRVPGSHRRGRIAERSFGHAIRPRRGRPARHHRARSW